MHLGPKMAIPTDCESFVKWLNDAQPGEATCYYRGELARDRDLFKEDKGRFHDANAAYDAFKANMVRLFQIPCGIVAGDARRYAYIAVRRG